VFDLLDHDLRKTECVAKPQNLAEARAPSSELSIGLQFHRGAVDGGIQRRRIGIRQAPTGALPPGTAPVLLVAAPC
jgi:hypothetical protein